MSMCFNLLAFLVFQVMEKIINLHLNWSYSQTASYSISYSGTALDFSAGAGL